MDIPHTQTTAPVFEFRCLYTSDLRRKQKRWQDGILKFHTFNKRVMVYDEKSNFLGDTHWRKDYDFGEGEELDLDRGGIMIEVGECVGKRDQDLTDLIDKRLREREDRAAAKHASTPSSPHTSVARQAAIGPTLLRPKSLNAVLGNPTRHYGKAFISTLSPFEERQQADWGELPSGRRAKRRKQDDTPPLKNGYAQSLIGSKLELTTSRPTGTAKSRLEAFKASIHRSPAATIDLNVDEDSRRPVAFREERIKTKSHQQKLHKVPSLLSGYAENHIGASLNLNQPEGFAIQRPIIGRSLGWKEGRQMYGIGISSSGKQVSFTEDNASQGRPTKRIQNHEELPTKKVKTSLRDPPVVSHYSSPLDVSSTLFSHSAMKEKVIRGSSLRQPTHQAGSTLRIKSRPRKMMMLLELSKFRSPAQIESLHDIYTASMKCQRPEGIRKGMIPSQATVRLDAFRAQQEQHLQDRLSGNGPIPEPDDSPPKVTDSAIVNRMTPSLLCLKTKKLNTVLPEPPTGIWRRPSISLAGNNDDDDDDDDDFFQARKSHSPGAVPQGDLLSSDVATVSLLSSHDPCDRPMDSKEVYQQNEGSLKILLNPTSPNSNATYGAKALRPDNPALVNQSEKDLAVDEQDDLGLMSLSRSAQIEEALFKNSSCTSDKSLLPRSPSPITKAITTSAALSQPPVHKKQEASAATLLEQTITVANAQKQEPNSGEFVIKASPKSLSSMLEVLANECQQASIGTSTTSMDKSEQIPPTEGHEQVSLLMANQIDPATHGSSIQRCANRVVNVRPPTVNAPPNGAPPSRTFNQPGRTLVQNVKKMEESIREVTSGGPWSRESFDLFGPWRPPKER